MSISGIPAADSKKIFYCVQQFAHPENPKKIEWTVLEKIKYLAGCILASLGCALLIGAIASLTGHVLGIFPEGISLFEILFTTGLMSTLTGFNLVSKPDHPSPDAYLSLGPLSITV